LCSFFFFHSLLFVLDNRMTALLRGIVGTRIMMLELGFY
jgi:hypothetical protein